MYNPYGVTFVVILTSCSLVVFKSDSKLNNYGPTSGFIDNLIIIFPQLMIDISCNSFDIFSNVSKWPPKLILNIIPKNVVQPLQELLHNSKALHFEFNSTTEDVKQLQNRMVSPSGNVRPLYSVSSSSF